MPPETQALAFFDFDGTVVSSNVVDQYLWLVRRRLSIARLVKLFLQKDKLKQADRQSRRLFNEMFYAHYRGLRQDWLIRQGRILSERYLGPKVYPKVRSLLERNLGEGFAPVLVTGSLDFSIAPLAESLGFTHVVANSLHFEDGVATGRIREPVIAGSQKVDAMLAVCRDRGVAPSNCRAYSDDTSDLPMLEAVGHPVAANPKPDLLELARQRGWPVEDLK
jgi:HAD superfamily hydrolase (TIGR01490 family)